MGQMTVTCKGTWNGMDYNYTVTARWADGVQLSLNDLGWTPYQKYVAEMRSGKKNQLVGNLQFYGPGKDGPHTALGDLPAGTTLILPPPPGDRGRGKQWNLHVWLPAGRGGRKKWHRLDDGKGGTIRELEKLGLGVESIRRQPDGGVQLTLTRWPENDLPICWDG